MANNSKDNPVVQSILAGISDMLSLLSEVQANQTAIHDIVLQGEDIRKQILTTLQMLDNIHNDLADLQNIVKDVNEENSKSSGMKRIAKSLSCIPELNQDIVKAKKQLDMASLFYSEIPDAIQNSNQLSSKADTCVSSDADQAKLAYEMSLNELEQVENYYNDICNVVSLVCYSLEETTESWEYLLNKKLSFLFLPAKQKTIYDSLHTSIPKVHNNAITISQQFAKLRENAKNNITQWKDLLDLYPIN